MKLDPGFLNHWKTERLMDQLGPEGVVAVLRLWGSAQIRRVFSGLPFTPKRLAMEVKWKGDEERLFSVLTDPDAPWLDQEPGGTFTIHGFAEYQHQVVKLWENGKKGGRPKKTTAKTSPSSSSSSSSSSSPICEPNENQMVFNGEPATRESARNQENSPFMIRLGKFLNRKPKTRWDEKERKALNKLMPLDPDDVDLMERYYLADIPADHIPGRRTDLITLLNNWNGELDRATVYFTTRKS